MNVDEELPLKCREMVGKWGSVENGHLMEESPEERVGMSKVTVCGENVGRS